jgi:predicted nucleic acid-binding protein
MIALPIFCVALLIYQTVRTYKAARARSERDALHASAARATDLEQWRSLDSE